MDQSWLRTQLSLRLQNVEARDLTVVADQPACMNGQDIDAAQTAQNCCTDLY
jgi:hypothetical protein